MSESFSEKIYNYVGEKMATQERSFFRKFMEGELTEEALKGYYRHLYHECSTFVRLVSYVHFLGEHRDQREVVAMNLVEEYCHGKGDSHPAMAMRVGCALGLSEEEIEEHGLLPEVKAAFDDLFEVIKQSYTAGLAVLTTIEFDLPIRHKIMRQVLQEQYGMNDSDLTYYHEHMEEGGVRDPEHEGYGGDDVHVARQVQILEKYADTPEKQDEVLRAIDATFDMRNRLVRALDAKYGQTKAAA